MKIIIICLLLLQLTLANIQTQQHSLLSNNVLLLQKYTMEICFIVVIFIALLNYKIGKKKNQGIIDKWLKSVQSILLENFAHIGFGDQSKSSVFLEESGHEFEFYATGRQNLSFFEGSFTLRKRQDFFSSSLLEFIFPEKDLLTIDIPIDNNILLVFCLCKKKEVKNIKQKCIDINSLTKNFDINNLNENYKIFGENSESIDFIFDGYVLKHLNQLQQIIYSIHYTDQHLYSNSPGHLRVILNANPKESEKNEQAIKLILYIVDKIAQLRLPQAIKTKSQRSREILSATKQKQQLEKKREQLQKIKSEKKKQEELRIKNLPPQKQKRAIQNQNKKEMSKRFRGKIMKML